MKKIIVSIILIIALISVNSNCFAKYIFEYNLIAAEIRINK